MSAFTPTQWTLEPPSRPDHLSGAVLHSLSRPIVGKLAWGPLKSLIVGGVSFGILPLVAWPRNFGRFVVAEQQQMWHLVEWLRVRTGDDEAVRLRNSVRDTGAAPTLWLVPLALLAILGFKFIPLLSGPAVGLHGMIDTTYGVGFAHGRTLLFHRMPFFGLEPWEPSHLYRVWTFCLVVGYLSHWLHVRQHVGDINRLVGRINSILSRQHVPPVQLCRVGIGFGPLWMLAGAVGVMAGAWWAIPAALSGTIHQRYVCRHSVRIRGELAQRVRTLLERQRPAIDVPTPHRLRLACRNQLCGKPAPVGALYCPRCGTRLATPLDAVA